MTFANVERRQMPMGRAALVLVAASALAACDPSYSFWFRNQANVTVIVQFVGSNHAGTGFLLRPGQAGDGFGSLGDRWTGTIRVVREDCSPVSEQSVSQRQGGVEIGADLTVRLVLESPEAASPPIPTPLTLASETGTCLPDGVLYQPVQG